MQGCGARRDSTIRANSLRSKCRFRDLSPAIGTKQNILTVNLTVKLGWCPEKASVFKRLRAAKLRTRTGKHTSPVPCLETKLQSVGQCSNDGRPVCALAHRDRDFSAPDSRRRAKKWWLSAPGNRQAGCRGVASALWCAFRGIDRHAARVESSDSLNQLSIQT